MLIATLTITILASTSANATNFCGVATTFPYITNNTLSTPTNFSYWGNITTAKPYLFNGTSNASLIDTACWDVGLPWEPINLVYKPFPNQCSNTYNSVCAENTENYSSYRTYFNAGITNVFCVNPDNTNWRWLNDSGGISHIRIIYPQICSGGANSIDNGCNGALYFGRNRNGGVNYSQWNATGTTYIVNTDFAAFAPTCYGRINGTVSDSNITPLANVNVTLLILGPQGEQQYQSTLTNASGNYAFNSIIPATDYRLLFSKTNYNSEVAVTKVNYTNTTTVNATLTSGTCNYDCTTQVDPSRCSAACNGIGGCAFYNTTVATILDGTVVNTNRLISIGATNYTITACIGAPSVYVQPSIMTTQISCPSGTSLIVLERIVLKDGQPIKVVIPVCRQS